MKKDPEFGAVPIRAPNRSFSFCGRDARRTSSPFKAKIYLRLIDNLVSSFLLLSTIQKEVIKATSKMTGSARMQIIGTGAIVTVILLR